MCSPAKKISWPTAAICIFTASYVPPLMAFAAGVGHCEVCRQAWFTVIWFVQGCVIPLFIQKFISLPHADESWGIAIAATVQLAWLASWIWLARLNKGWLWGSTAIAFGLSVWFAWAMDSLILM